MNSVKYGIVVVTYNRLPLLKECISCIVNQRLEVSSLIIVNNNSTDGTKEYLDSLEMKSCQFKVKHSSKNIGGAGGFELGVKAIYKDVDYLLLIDDDAMLSQDYLFCIDSALDDNIFAYSGSVTTNGIIDTSHRRRINNKVFLTKQDVFLEEYNYSFFDYDLSSFCGLCFKTSLINHIGFPNGEYFIWYDDTEYSLRIRKYTKIRNINKAIINHKTIISEDSRLNWKSFYGYRNMIEIGKHHSLIPFIFCSYRYIYHLYRSICYFFNSLLLKSTSEKHYYLMASKLHFRVVVQSIQGKMGIDGIFKPGMKLYYE